MPPEHSLVTEVMIVVTQTAFYVILFLALKKTLVDSRRRSYNRMKEDWMIHAAVYFAIFVLIVILMTPLHSYAFIHYIVPSVLCICAGIVIRDVYNDVYLGRGAQDTFKDGFRDEYVESEKVESVVKEKPVGNNEFLF